MRIGHLIMIFDPTNLIMNNLNHGTRPFFNRKLRVNPITWQRITKLVLYWLLRLLQPLYHIGPSLFDCLQSNLARRQDARGILDTIKYVKDMRVVLLGILSETYESNPNIPMKDGYPKAFGPQQVENQKVQSQRRYVLLRLVLTILYSTRALSVGKNPKFESITDAPKGNWNISKTEVRSFWKALGFWTSRSNPGVPKQVRFSNYHFSTKGGPNGHALWSAVNDLKVLPVAQRRSIEVVGGRKLTEYMNRLMDNIGAITNRDDTGTSIRRISWFPDKEDKMRVIAIQDFWSQTALVPMHKFLFRLLKKIPQDCTFDQGKLLEKLSKTDGVKYSCDLSAATDRFPINFIGAVLEGRFAKSFVAAWKDILIGYPFEKGTGSIDPVTKSKVVEKISYSVGNPMGAYTSWASFALAHHFVVYSCCIEAGIAWELCSYAILGDDIVICNEIVAKIYQRKMSELGVEVSLAKSHVSKKTLEFAKRFFYNGVEISPFPLSAVKETCRKVYLLADLFSEQIDRGWALTSVETSVAKFYEVVFASNSSFRSRSARTAFAVSQQMAAIRGKVSGAKFLSEFCVRYSVPQVRELTDNDFIQILSMSAREAFADAMEKIERDTGNPQGLLAENLVIRILTDPSIKGNPDTLLAAVPLLHAHGQIGEVYGKVCKEARAVSTELRDWPSTLKTIVQPRDDRIYSERSSHTIMKGAALISSKQPKQLLNFLELIPRYAEMHNQG